MQSKLKLHSSFAECEREELRCITTLQDGLGCLALDDEGRCIAHSRELFGLSIDELTQTLSPLQAHSTAVPKFFELTHWRGFHHRSGEVTLVEFEPAHRDHHPITIELPAVMNNHLHYCQTLCENIRRSLPYSRVMVYQLHENGSGEVIAESIDSALEPFIGLHYPATDIPKQARALYSEILARSVFSAQTPSNQLSSDHEMSIDLTQLISRGISEFHLTYLRNMGSEATASLAIHHEGELWGLVSLHSDRPLAPSLSRHHTLRELYGQVNQALREVFILSEQAQSQRQANLLTRFEAEVGREFDLAYSLFLSNFALHRLLGGVGASVLVADGLSQVGVTPPRDQTAQLLRQLQQSAETTAFCEGITGTCLDSEDSLIGGYAYFRLSTEPHSAILVFRRQVSQTVAWGGDPRRLGQGDSVVRYTPRASFERWVETVEGSCIPWENRAKSNLDAIIQTVMRRFGCADTAALSVLLGYSIRQLAYTRSKLLQKLNEQFDQLRQGIAIAIQTESNGPKVVLGINEAASDAFNIPLQEAENMTLDNFAATTNIPFDEMQIGRTQQASVWTHDQGHRDLEVEVYQQLDFHSDSSEESLRVLIYFMNDITQAKRVEMALNAAYRRSQKMVQIQNELFSKLMHELKTPLNSIIGFSSFLNDESLSPAEREDFCERVLRNARALRHVIESSGLENARLRADVAEDEEQSDLATLVENVINDLALMSNERSIEVVFNPEMGHQLIRVSPMAMTQVITNLVHNAIKYSEPGQTIDIRTGIEAGHTYISVEDQGIGMTSEQIRAATQPFTRFTERPGSGLGLSIVKQLLEANDCDLAITSGINRGTTMTVRIPTIRLVTTPATVEQKDWV